MPYRFEHNRSYMLNDKKYVIKENLIDGEKGLAFSFILKEGEKFNRISVKETSKDVFSFKEKINNDAETTKELDIKEFKKILKANKNLEFVRTYFDNERGKYKGLNDDMLLSEELSGGKKTTKKTTTKKTSKKPSKKISKKKLSKKKISKKSW